MELHDQTLPDEVHKEKHFCSMCGEHFCSMRANRTFRQTLLAGQAPTTPQRIQGIAHTAEGRCSQGDK